MNDGESTSFRLKFASLILSSVEYINYNAKGRDVLDIGLSGFHSTQEHVNYYVVSRVDQCQ